MVNKNSNIDEKSSDRINNNNINDNSDITNKNDVLMMKI